MNDILCGCCNEIPVANVGELCADCEAIERDQIDAMERDYAEQLAGAGDPWMVNPDEWDRYGRRFDEYRYDD